MASIYRRSRRQARKQDRCISGWGACRATAPSLQRRPCSTVPTAPSLQRRPCSTVPAAPSQQHHPYSAVPAAPSLQHHPYSTVPAAPSLQCHPCSTIPAAPSLQHHPCSTIPAPQSLQHGLIQDLLRRPLPTEQSTHQPSGDALGLRKANESVRVPLLTDVETPILCAPPKGPRLSAWKTPIPGDVPLNPRFLLFSRHAS